MNIFPTRKCGLNISNNHSVSSQKKNNTNKYPSIKDYHNLNEQLLKTYLKIDVEGKVEQNLKKKKKSKISSQKTLNEVILNVFELNKQISYKQKKYNLYIYKLSNTLTLSKHIEYLQKNNFNYIFDTYDISDIENIINTNKLNDINIKEIVTLSLQNLIKTSDITSFCNIWIFGHLSSVLIQTTYIPITQGAYSGDDYLDLNVNSIIYPFEQLNSAQIFNNIETDKRNQELYFLVFK